jgi:hypothetical protein
MKGAARGSPSDIKRSMAASIGKPVNGKILLNIEGNDEMNGKG